MLPSLYQWVFEVVAALQSDVHGRHPDLFGVLERRLRVTVDRSKGFKSTMLDLLVPMESNVAYEDLFALAQKVVEVCLMRGGKDGVLGKMLGAMGMQTTAEIAPGLKARLEEARAIGREDLSLHTIPREPTEL